MQSIRLRGGTGNLMIGFWVKLFCLALEEIGNRNALIFKYKLHTFSDMSDKETNFGLKLKFPDIILSHT